MILRLIFSICLFISLNSVVLAGLPTNDNFSKLNKINFVQNVEAAKEKFLLKDYQGVINLLSINIKSKDIPNSYLVESLINRANTYLFINDYNNAKADYLKCLNIDLCQRADVNLNLGKLEVAPFSCGLTGRNCSKFSASPRALCLLTCLHSTNK